VPYNTLPLNYLARAKEKDGGVINKIQPLIEGVVSLLSRGLLSSAVFNCAMNYIRFAELDALYSE